MNDRIDLSHLGPLADGESFTIEHVVDLIEGPAGKPWERDWIRDWEPAPYDPDAYAGWALAQHRGVHRITGHRGDWIILDDIPPTPLGDPLINPVTPRRYPRR